MTDGRSRGQLFFVFVVADTRKMTMCGRKETVACAQTMFYFAIPRFPPTKNKSRDEN